MHFNQVAQGVSHSCYGLLIRQKQPRNRSCIPHSTMLQITKYVTRLVNNVLALALLSPLTRFPVFGGIEAYLTYKLFRILSRSSSKAANRASSISGLVS